MSTATVEDAILAAVKVHVNTLPMIDDFPVVWINSTAYDPDASTPYIRASLHRNKPRRLFIGSSDPHQRPNILQLDVMAKRSWTGEQAEHVGGQIAAHFPPDLRMSFGDVTCRVTDYPHVVSAMAGNAFMQVPVMIELETLA